MAYSFTFETDARSTNNNSVTTSSTDTTGATLIVIACVHEAAGAVAPTDSKGNTWTALTRYKHASCGVDFYYCVNPTVGSGHTFTLSSTGDFPAIAVVGFSGAAASPFDGVNGSNGGTTSTATGNLTPSENDCLVVTAGGFNSTNTPSVSSPFSSNVTAALGGTANAYGIGLAYEIQTTATLRNATWTSGAGGMAVTIAAFKAAAAAASTQNYLTLLGVG